jgi:WhiB family redox-sensing transcriptional regulator
MGGRRAGIPNLSTTRNQRPAMSLDSLEWQTQARCRGCGPAIFYPEKSGPAQAREALMVCAGCPVRDVCLDHALTHREQGVWGGVTEEQRGAMLRAKRRNEARQRKAS